MTNRSLAHNSVCCAYCPWTNWSKQPWEKVMFFPKVGVYVKFKDYESTMSPQIIKKGYVMFWVKRYIEKVY